jgi:hypothetical protein
VRHRACSASSVVDNQRHIGSDSKDCMLVITGLFAIGHNNIIIKLLKLAYFTPLTSVITQRSSPATVSATHQFVHGLLEERRCIGYEIKSQIISLI